MTSDRFRRGFEELTGRPATGVWVAPGRVNLIGEHTDYSGGLVLPMALPQACAVAAALRDDDVITVRSRQRAGEVIRSPVTARPGEVTGWAGYAVGIVWALRAAGHDVGGVDLVLDSDVPIGAGLSSSASVGCSVAIALRDLNNLPLNGPELAAIARDCENTFVGAPTGVMDQAVSMNATAGHLYFLDTRSMRAEQVPFDLGAHGLTLLVIDTLTTHEHSHGGYASRRQAVEDAARLLGVPELRDIPFAELNPALAGLTELARLTGLTDPVIARRARHVVTENARVLAVVDILNTGADPREVGPILTAGHRSLRDDFEISTPELDTAVDAALAAGAFGARMTGGGFGGSAIALVSTSEQDAVRTAVDKAFAQHDYRPPRHFTAHPAPGAHPLPLTH
jgi:galactokinase